jgi:hypothetical protein
MVQVLDRYASTEGLPGKRESKNKQYGKAIGFHGAAGVKVGELAEKENKADWVEIGLK